MTATRHERHLSASAAAQPTGFVRSWLRPVFARAYRTKRRVWLAHGERAEPGFTAERPEHVVLPLSDDGRARLEAVAQANRDRLAEAVARAEAAGWSADTDDETPVEVDDAWAAGDADWAAAVAAARAA